MIKYILPFLFLACVMEIEDIKPDGKIVDYSKEKNRVLGENNPCQQFLNEITVFETKDPIRFCDTSNKGCYIYPHNYIFIDIDLSTERKKEITIHEYIHALALCELGDGDPEHNNPELWEGIK